MRVCAVQMDTVWEDKSANMPLCREFARQAAGKCELLVFPELSLTGFSMNKSLAEPPNGETERFFCALSEEFGIAIAYGFACSEGGRITNRLCVSQGGRTVARYDKLHPFSYGGEIFSAGDRVAFAEVAGMRLGLAVCYDLRFPELFSRLSRECGGIVVIANWPEKRRDHWLALLKARAIENQCYIVGCNRTGAGGGLCYSGDSAVFSPTGELISGAPPNEESLVFAELSQEVVSRAREDFPVSTDRRPSLYREFY